MKKKALLACIMAIIILLGACSKPVSNQNSNGQNGGNAKADPEPKAIPPAKYTDVPQWVSPLTGLEYNGDGRGIMVQIENTPEARPQSGITKADLLYEMEVESKITRLTAFFLENYPSKVGPVRSARRQHMYLWSEWDYLYAFYGGSEPKGQNIYTIKKDLGVKAPTINGMTDSAYFVRAKDRKSPHNAYTNLQNIIKDAYDYSPKQRSLYFDEEVIITGTPVEELSFSYSPKNKVKYSYDAQTKLYDRFINDTPMVDKENDQQLAVKNIIIQHGKHYKVQGSVYTNIDLVGSGKAMYFTEGVMREGTWERKSESDLTIYYDQEGKEICFMPGVSFIQIVRDDTQVDLSIEQEERDSQVEE